MLKDATRDEGNKTPSEDPSAKPRCCPRKVSKLGLLRPCWEAADAAAAMGMPGTPVSVCCTLTGAHVFRGTCRGGTRVMACGFPCSHEPGAEHRQHGVLVVLVPGVRLCQHRSVARVCAHPPDRAGAFGRLSCLQTAAFVGFSPFIAMETVIKPR